MTRIEFNQQLRAALENELNANQVEENVKFYDQYITDEIGKGKREEEVLELLGDPWILARTIIDALDGTDKATVYDAGGTTGKYSSDTSRTAENKADIRMIGLNAWWKKLLLILGIIMIIVVVFSIITGLISLLAPIVIPIIVVMIVIRVVTNRRS